MSVFHEPVLLSESVDGLLTKKNGRYVDATFGGGGHSSAILNELMDGGQLFAFDQDEDALTQGFNDARLTLVRSNFRYIGNYLRYYGAIPVDGILADLGVSSYQLDAKHKGFSFQGSERLDMRMNQASLYTAEAFLGKTTESELVQVLSEYGEVRNAKTLARAIIEKRKFRPLKTMQELIQCVEPYAIGNRSRYFAQVFQAIRIKVNDEMGALQALLKTSGQILRPGGRLVIITYHSVEDRMVKHFMKHGVFEKLIFSQHRHRDKEKSTMKMVHKKPILAKEIELRRNRRARSAKLRIAEKI